MKTHGQNDSRTLLDTSEHIRILDAYAGCDDLIKQYAGLLAKLKDIHARQKQILTDTAEMERRLDMLRFQINEIESSAVKPNEDEELERRKRRLKTPGK